MKPPSAFGFPYEGWRTGQRAAIRTALSSKKPHVVIQAPTGAGKSLVAAAIGKMKPLARVVTLTATNALLEQYTSTFRHLSPVRGAGTYECLAARDELRRYFRLKPADAVINCADGPCRAGIHCSLKAEGCTYFDAIRAASASKTPLTNYAFWLAMRRYAGGLGLADVVVFDEAHSLPEELMKAFRIDIFAHEVSRPRPRSITDWKLFAAMKVDSLKKGAGEDEDQRIRRQKAIERFVRLSEIDDSWAYDRTDAGWTFEPTIPSELFLLAGDLNTKFVYLSATITPGMLRLLNIPESDVEFCALTSSFPLSRRPVYLVPSARVDYKMDDVAKGWWLDRIDKFISQRLDRKGILHTVSYRRQREIVEHSHFGSRGRGIMLAPGPRDLGATIERFRELKPPAILVAPSIEQGFDFPYEDAEFVIIAKVPFPDTRSAIMKARIAATAGYRDHLTMQRIVQAAGRAMRAEDDQCEVAIFDDHARWFLTKHADLAPQWFLDALQWPRLIPLPLPKL